MVMGRGRRRCADAGLLCCCVRRPLLLHPVTRPSPSRPRVTRSIASRLIIRTPGLTSIAPTCRFSFQFFWTHHSRSFTRLPIASSSSTPTESRLAVAVVATTNQRRRH